jgi:hypothetical protein
MFGLALLTARRLGAKGFAAIVLCLVAAVASHSRMLPRPETLAAVLLGAYLWILERRRQGGGDATLALPALALVWANVHISYFLGLFVLGTHAGWATAVARRPPPAHPGRLWGVLAGCVVTSFVNPFGWRALWEPFAFALRGRSELVYRTIDELQPLSFTDSWMELTPLVILLWPALWLWRASRGRRDPLELVLLVVLFALAWSSRRFVGFFAVAMAPYAARAACEWVGGLTRPASGRAPGWAAAGAATALCALAAAPTLLWSHRRLGIGIDPAAEYRGVCDFIERHDVRGRMFNHFHVGGYLLWRLWPDRLPFTDIHQAGTREDMTAYVLALHRREAWERLAARREFDHVVLDRTFQAESLAVFLESDPRWSAVFVDDVGLLFLRRGASHDALIERYGYRRLLATPAGWAQVAGRAEQDSSLRRELGAELDRAIAESADHQSLCAMRADLALLDRDYGAARRYLERAHQEPAAIPRYHERLGLAALGEGDAAEALRQFRLQLRRWPGAADLEARIGEAHLAMGDTAAARAQFLRELAKHPGSPLARARLEALGAPSRAE